MISLEGLNQNQRQAVAWNEGPLLVLAGPGSGKTRVLTLRVARLLQESEDCSVLALTFTNKAAAEMRERVEALMGRRAERAHLCTFHSFAADLIRQHGSHLGLSPDFTLLTLEEDRLAMLEPIAAQLSEAGHSIPFDLKNLLAYLDRLFAYSYEGGPVSPKMEHVRGWVPVLFERYCAEQVRTNRLDFGTLLLFARKLLKEHRGVARITRIAWTHICVDEFQDTNKSQYDLLQLLVTGPRPNLFIVGDDDQIIYQWNGASPQRLFSIRSDYEMTLVQLPENYRCPPEIVDLANKLIQRNSMRTADKQPLTASRTSTLGEDVIRYEVYASALEESEGVARDIKSRRLDPSKTVVLARTSKTLEQAARALTAAGFDAYVSNRKNEFITAVLRVMFSALRLANARHDRDVLRRLCVAWKDLTEQPLEVEDIAGAAGLLGGDFLRAWAEATEEGSALGDPLDTEASRLHHQLVESLVNRLQFPDIVEWFLTEGAKPWGAMDPEVAEEITTWRELHNDLLREYSPGELTLNVYLQQLDLVSKAPRPGQNAIRCMTVHGSKGLEFHHVYLMGMAQEVFPSYHALKQGPSSRELEEERRNCFVAITRVQETLTLTRAREYAGYQKRPSQFIAELEIEEPARRSG